MSPAFSPRLRAIALVAGAIGTIALLQWPGEARAQGAQGGVLDDIVVTARRREERLQDTPISITAFEGQELDRRQIDKLSAIDSFTPNLQIDTATTFSGSNATASVFIRGIGQIDFTTTTEPGVGIYLDGVYISQTIGSVLDLVDVERVEVLRGPQGTLFGRNTIGGAISVTTVKPDTEALFGDVKVTVGEDSRTDIRGVVNLPITDTLAARLSAAHFERDGYIDTPNLGSGNELGDIDQDVLRAAVRWTPNERFTADFTADWSEANENGAPIVNSVVRDGLSLAFIGDLANPASPNYVPPPGPLPAPSFVDLHNLLATNPLCVEGGVQPLGDCAAPNPLFLGPTITSADTQPRDDSAKNFAVREMASDTEVWGVGLTLEYDFGPFVAKSITSYREVDAFTSLDNDGLEVLNNELVDEFDTEQTTQEFQFTGTLFEDRLTWLVGAYFFREEGTNLDDVEFTPVHILSGAEVDNESDAGFAQLTFDFTDRLSLTAGMRYTDETKEFKVSDKCRQLPKGPQPLLADPATVITCTPIQTVIDPKYLNQGFLEFVGAPVFPDDPDPNARVCCLPISDAAGNVVSLVRGLNPGDEVVPRGTYKADFDEWTPMVSLSYNWTDDLLTYVSYSEGFKSGGWVQRVFPPKTEVPSFEPETAKVVEFGAKWSADQVRINSAVFFTDYEDLQIEVNDGIAPVTRNAAEAEIWGFEIEALAVPTENLVLQAGLGYLDAEYTELDPSENFSTDVVELTKDSELVNAPEWSYNVSGEYTWPFANDSALVARVDYAWVDDHFKSALNFPETEQESYGLWDAYLTWVGPEEKIEASLFVQNLTDENYIQSAFANGLTQGKSQVSIARQRQWGASLQYRFGKR